MEEGADRSFDDGETAAYQTLDRLDFAKGQGPFRGYTKISFAEGFTFILKYQGIIDRQCHNPEYQVVPGKLSTR